MTETDEASSFRGALAAWGAAAVWAALILWGSGDQLSGARTFSWVEGVLEALGVADPIWWAPVVNVALRKLAHLLEYGVLGVLLWRALRKTRPAWSGRRLLWSMVPIAVSCACLDEVRQASVAGRTGSPVDVLVDAVGATLGVLVLFGGRRQPGKLRAAVPSRLRDGAP